MIILDLIPVRCLPEPCPVLLYCRIHIPRIDGATMLSYYETE